jgi:Ras-related protein Rab-21
MEGTIEFTVVTLGESSVGKTSITRRYCEDTFEEKHRSTVNAASMTKDIYVESMRVSLDIWDTAGQERHRAIASNYYRKAQGALVVFDISNRDSFKRVRDWINELSQQCRGGVSLLVVGNKSDLETQRQVEHAKAEELANNVGAKLVYTSAKTGEGIYQAFEILAMDMVKRKKAEDKRQNKSKTTTRRNKNIVIQNNPAPEPVAKKSGCCS